MPLRVLVCGGRDYKDASAVNTLLSSFKALRGIALIIEGGATGADRLARKWAQAHHVPFDTYSAQWRKPDGSTDYGAGPRRNAEMLSKGQPHVVVAFPGGNGTADMIAKAKAAGVEVVVYGQNELFD